VAPHYEPWTPVQVETKLAELMNEVAQAELAMRRLLEQEADAKLEYERAHVIAATDPRCPVPSRGGATVGERDSWIRGMVEDEYRGLEYSQLNVTIQKRYIERLSQQASLCQTMSKHVLAAYAISGARGTGGSY
jgi:hypothetical protein